MDENRRKIMRISLKNIYKSYTDLRSNKIQVLENISFDIEESEFLSILGPSGCGKTTLLKVIATLEHPDRGEVIFAHKQEGIKTPIVWQEHRLFPWRTVIQNIKFGLELTTYNEDEVEKTVYELIEMIGLRGFENYYPYQLSGGMAQRVAIARSMAVNPDILLLDEPFASVDYQTKLILCNEIKEIQEKTKKTIVYVTHDIRDAISFTNRTIILSARPARVKEIISLSGIELPFSSVEKKIWEILKPEIDIKRK